MLLLPRVPYVRPEASPWVCSRFGQYGSGRYWSVGKSSRRYRAAYLINIRTSEVSVHKLFVTHVTAAIGLIRLGSVALGVLEVWTVWDLALLVRREELSVV